MSFPSLTAAARRTGETFARFPVPVLSAGLAVWVVVNSIEGPALDWHGRLLAIAGLGLTLTLAQLTTAERRGWTTPVRLLATGGLLLLLALLYLGSLKWSDNLAAIRFAPLLLAAHLLVAAGPFIGRGSQMEFWHYNRFLFIRFLTAAIYAAVLWAGLSLALVALDKLFGVEVPDKAYAKLWASFAFGFHPWFFLAGIPRDYAGLDQRDDYPVGLKVFAQFVLIPLVTVYLLILTTYLAKVLITQTWPSGWIGYLVSCVSAAGVLALLLVHPVRTRADSTWVNAYGRWWFVAIIPSLLMLLVAIGKRVGQYGITEPRYYLLVLAVWMLAVALYYGITAATTIKPIPATLAAVALLTSGGPWSATSVSIASQRHRFTTLLAANGMGRAGAPTRATGSVSREDRREMSEILSYLERTHGRAVLASAMGVSLDTLPGWPAGDGTPGDNSTNARALRTLGLEPSGLYGPGDRQGQFWATVQTQRSIDVTGFDLTRSISYPTLGSIGTATDSLTAEVGGDSATVVVRHGADTVVTLGVRAAVSAVLASDTLAHSGRNQLSAPVIMNGEGGGYRVRLVLESITGRHLPAGPVLTGGSGYLLVAGVKPLRP